ncbi:MAG: hypothetical protein ABR586_09430 [Thermoplasmatota archaeon]
MSNWKVNGTTLDIGAVKVTMEAETLSLDEALRTQFAGILHGRQRRHRLGINLPALKFTFWFWGVAPDRYDVMQRLRTDLKRAANFLVEAPAAPNEFYFEGGVKTIRLACESMRVVYTNGVGRVGLEVVATHIDPEATELLGLSNVQLVGAPVVTVSKVTYLVATTALNKTVVATPTRSFELIIITPIATGITISAAGLSNGIFRTVALTATAVGLSNGITRGATATPGSAGSLVPIIASFPQAASDANGTLSGLNNNPAATPSNTPTLTVT